MNVTSFNGTVSVHDTAALRDYLDSTRQGQFGAFHLDHGLAESLMILINQDFAYLYFFPDNDGQHPGYQSTGMSPEGLHGSVWFEQEHSGAGFDIDPEFVVPIDVAYRAAMEYFVTPGLPSSVTWYDFASP